MNKHNKYTCRRCNSWLAFSALGCTIERWIESSTEKRLAKARKDKANNQRLTQVHKDRKKAAKKDNYGDE